MVVKLCAEGVEHGVEAGVSVVTGVETTVGEIGAGGDTEAGL